LSDFVLKPLNKRMNLGNPVTRIEKLERATGPAPSASVESLDDLSTLSGIIRGELILAPASGVETEEVTSTDYTGVFISGDGKVFLVDTWNLGGVNAGVLQFGLNALNGKAYAGAGAVVLDVDGIAITIDSLSDVTNQNAIKFLKTGVEWSRIVGYKSGGANLLTFKANAITGTPSGVNINATAPSTFLASVGLNAQSGTTVAGIGLSADSNGTSVITINPTFDGNVNMDVNGTSGTPITTHNSGTNVFTLRRHFVMEQALATISSDSVAITNPFMIIDTEAAAATDNLATITGAQQEGQYLVLRSTNNGRDITVKDGTGNIQLSGGDRLLSNVKDKLVLIWDGTDWCELSFADNI